MGNVQHSSTVYCSVDDVMKYIRTEGGVDSTSNPTDNDILDWIRRKSARIDAYTRHAWRANTVVEEMHTHSGPYRWDRGRPVVLNKMQVRDPDGAEGDKIELWHGDSWNDWVSDPAKSLGRENEYWVDNNAGILYLYDRFVWRARPQIRVTYRYGDELPTTTETLADGTNYEVIDPLGGGESGFDIMEACEKLVAAEFLMSDQYSQFVPGGEGAPSATEAAQQYREDAGIVEGRKGILDRHRVDPAWVEPY